MKKRGYAYAGIATLLMLIAAQVDAKTIVDTFDSGGAFDSGDGYNIVRGIIPEISYGFQFTPEETDFTLTRIALAAGLSEGDNILEISIVEDDGGQPGGSVIATYIFSGEMGSFGDDNTVLVASFSNGPVFTADTPYWLVARIPKAKSTWAFWNLSHPRPKAIPTAKIRSSYVSVGETFFPAAFRIEGAPVQDFKPVAIDIRPGACPNPLNIRSKGVLPVALLGGADFDVASVDPTTVQLAGSGALRWSIEDVSTPAEDGDGDDCPPKGTDGFADLTLKFDAQEIIAALGEVGDGNEVPLALTGQLYDGTPIEGTDCVVIHAKGKAKKPIASLKNDPNPFNPSTVVQYTLDEASEVRLTIYSALGQRVRVLVNTVQAAGAHSVQWDGRDASGRTAATGAYLCHLQAGSHMVVRKMLLSK